MAGAITTEDSSLHLRTKTVEKTTTHQQEKANDTYVARIVNFQDPEEVRLREERRAGSDSKKSPEYWKSKIEKRTPQEFGGPVGALAIIFFSHVIVWYFFLCLHVNKGNLLLPNSLYPSDIIDYYVNIFQLLYQHAFPTMYAVGLYWGFQIFQIICYVTLPGFTAYGLPLPTLNGEKLTYHCNALTTWYVSLASMAVLHFTGVFKFGTVLDHIGPITTVAVLSADIVALAIYIYANYIGEAEEDNTGNVIYDFFMGSILNPRIKFYKDYVLDIKMYCEVRISWIMLFIIISSAAYKFYELHGYISHNMALLITGQLLYCQAIMKGEEKIPPTWDIYHEKYGFLLCFWNLAGVPLVYSAQALYIYHTDPAQIELPSWLVYSLYVVLFTSYYLWDVSMSQKSSFRLMYNNKFQPRPFAFPQLPWSVLENPTYLKTKAGTPLLLSGLYQFLRKPNYITDMTMAFVWCLAAGFGRAVIPSFYVCFFVGMLIHRNARDDSKCRLKYGRDWEEYCSRVPYVFIPGVY